MTKKDLLERYEATGDPAAFEEAARLYEEALAVDPDHAGLRHEYGYLLECHGRELIREAATQYEHAIELEPTWQKPRLQLISARAALHETHGAIAHYERRLASSPDDLDEHLYLASAYLAAREFAKAQPVVEAALSRAPEDARFVELLGDVCAGTDRPKEALEHWACAHELDPDTLSSIYSSAFLLEHEGRLREAAETWRYIVEWCEGHGYTLDSAWPKRQLERLNDALRP